MAVATNVAEYVRRIQEALGDREPMAVLNQTAGALHDLSQTLTSEEMQYRPVENKWSIAEIMAHLADAEVVTTFRVLHILTNVDGVVIPAYDQDAYASVDATATFRVRNRSRCLPLSGKQILERGMHSRRIN